MNITIFQIIMFIIMLVLISATLITTYKNIKLSGSIDKLMDGIETIDESIPKLNINDRLSYTEKLLNFIDTLIEFEVINEKRFELILGTPDKNLDIDKVLKNVSTKVYESIQKDVYLNPNNMVTSTYLMEYIQKKTFITCMSYIQNNVNNQTE